jgi:hypothetical protein
MVMIGAKHFLRRGLSFETFVSFVLTPGFWRFYGNSSGSES